MTPNSLPRVCWSLADSIIISTSRIRWYLVRTFRSKLSWSTRFRKSFWHSEKLDLEMVRRATASDLRTVGCSERARSINSACSSCFCSFSSKKLNKKQAKWVADILA